MTFLYADWIPSPEGGFEPDLPANDGYGLYGSPGRDSGWALFSVSLTDDATVDNHICPGAELEALLYSGMAYPPALALSRDDLERHFKRENPPRQEFEAYYCKRLYHYLSKQDTCGYLLAQASHDELGYLTKGGFYWLVGYLADRKMVKWVSGDYHVYTNDAAHFDIPRHRLVPLSWKPIDQDEFA